MLLNSTSPRHADAKPSDWVVRWSHLVPTGGSVLDVACGSGRHMQWFAGRGHAVTGVDRSDDALRTASAFGGTLLADIEDGPWPFGGQHFDAVVVTNYLWRARLPDIVAAVAPGGVLLYETFAAGNETIGKPSRADFLLQPGELIAASAGLRVVAYEDGYEDGRPGDHQGAHSQLRARFVQRIAAIRPAAGAATPSGQRPLLRPSASQ